MALVDPITMADLVVVTIMEDLAAGNAALRNPSSTAGKGC
jgi:hypothetical protein